jgi:fatty acid synthase subunit alpha, fungi type
LQKEFGSLPVDSPENVPIDELGGTIQPSFNGALGKHTAGLVTRLISSKFPGGFNITQARAYLSTRWGLGSGRSDSVMLLALTNEPAARLGGEADAKTFLDSMAQKHASRAGVTLASPAAAAAGGGGGAVVDSAAMEALTKSQKHLVGQQMELFARYLDKDLRSGDKLAVAEKEISARLRAQLDLWMTEHGEFYAAGIEPVFSRLKARVYDSSWNWVRQDAMSMFYDIIFGRLSVVSRDIVARYKFYFKLLTPGVLPS